MPIERRTDNGRTFGWTVPTRRLIDRFKNLGDRPGICSSIYRSASSPPHPSAHGIPDSPFIFPPRARSCSFNFGRGSIIARLTDRVFTCASVGTRKGRKRERMGDKERRRVAMVVPRAPGQKRRGERGYGPEPNISRDYDVRLPVSPGLAV